MENSWHLMQYAHTRVARYNMTPPVSTCCARVMVQSLILRTQLPLSRARQIRHSQVFPSAWMIKREPLRYNNARPYIPYPIPMLICIMWPLRHRMYFMRRLLSLSRALFVVYCPEMLRLAGRDDTPHTSREQKAHAQLRLIECCEWREVLAEIC